MKKKIFGLIATVLFGSLGFSQKATLIDAKGSEIAIIINRNDNNSFKEYYLLQYNNVDFLEITNEIDISVVEINEDQIKLKSNNKVFTLTIDSNYRNSNEKVFLGYGLSRRLGNFSLIKDFLNPASISDVVLVNNVLLGKGSTCHSGGKGSTECSVTPSPLNVGTPSCSVKCGTGYYSCCDDTKGECGCVKDSTKIVKSVAP